jgi:hypothetical protein
MFQIAGEQGDFDVPSGYRLGRRHRFVGEGDGLDPLTGQSSTSKNNKSKSLKPAFGPQLKETCSCCQRRSNAVAALAAHPDNPSHFKYFRFSSGAICEPCTMLANFIRQVCSHGKTPTGAFGDYLSREESKVALARTKERIDENFEDGLVASYEAQSPDNPSGAAEESVLDGIAEACGFDLDF